MDISKIKEYLSVPTNCTVQIKEVNPNSKCYRVNVFSQTYQSGRVVPTTQIVGSYYICSDGENFVNKTIM